MIPQSALPANPLLRVDVEGFEGPLDLLLELSRRQKVDLAKISILSLAEQYLEFIEEVRKLRIELAADYLVMAAWLAYLKSKLLLPEPDEEDGPSGEELAAHLAFRLKRLEAMREAGKRLVNRNRLGRDFFVRGVPEPIVIDKQKEFSATLYDSVDGLCRTTTTPVGFSCYHSQTSGLVTARRAGHADKTCG